MIYLSEGDVRKTLTIAEAIDLAERGIKADAEGRVVGDKFYMPVGNAGFIKPFSGYILGEEYAFVKTFSFFPENPENHGLPATSSLVLLFDARTGYPVCLMEASWVTGLKTCASTSVTAARLANADSKTLAIFGAGLLGRLHLQALALTLPSLRKAWLMDVKPQVAVDLAQEMTADLQFGVEAVPLAERERVVRQADIVVTVTTGSQALVERDWLKPGCFVARLGSYQELALDVITKADKVVVDCWKYVSPRIPELVSLKAEGLFGLADVYAEWPDVVAGRSAARESPSEVIVFIALGIWGEYAAILPEVYRRAVEKGLGKELG